MKKLLVAAIFSIILTAWNIQAPQIFAGSPAPAYSGGITNPVIGNLGGNNPSGVGSITEAESGATFLRYFVILWQAIITVGGLGVILMFLWGSIEWITSGGDSGKLQKARDKIIQSFIGLVVLVGSMFIIGFIGQVLFGSNFDILNMSIPTP